MKPNTKAARTLGDIIMEKITERQTELATQLTGVCEMEFIIFIE